MEHATRQKAMNDEELMEQEHPLESSDRGYTEDEKELAMKCMALASESQLGIFLYDVKSDEQGNILNEDEVNKRMTDKVRPIIRYANGYLYIDLEFPAGEDINLKSIKHFYELYLDANTRYYGDDTRHYLYVINLTGMDDDGESYSTEAINPLFLSHEDNVLRFVVEAENVHFAHMEVDIEQLNLQLEVDAEVSGDYGDEE